MLTLLTENRGYNIEGLGHKSCFNIAEKTELLKGY